MRRAIALRLALLVSVCAAPVSAEGAAVEKAALSWVREPGAESCPAEADVARSVEQRLGRPTLVPAASAELVLQTRLSALPDGRFHVEIAMQRGQEEIGRRVLESDGPTCQVVAENAALVIALAIDPEASPDPLPIEAAPAEPPPEPPAPPPSAPPKEIERPPAPAAPSERAAWQGDVELAFGVASGTVPKLSPGLFARGRLYPPRLPLGAELQGGFLLPGRAEVESNKGADFQQVYAGLALCSRPPRARLSASLCVGADVGSLTAQGYGFSYEPPVQAWTYTLSARGRVGFRPIRGLAIVTGPDVVVPLKRDYFEVNTAEGTEPLFRMSAVGFGFALGAVWEL